MSRPADALLSLPIGVITYGTLPGSATIRLVDGSVAQVSDGITTDPSGLLRGWAFNPNASELRRWSTKDPDLCESIRLTSIRHRHALQRRDAAKAGVVSRVERLEADLAEAGAEVLRLQGERDAARGKAASRLNVIAQMRADSAAADAQCRDIAAERDDLLVRLGKADTAIDAGRRERKHLGDRLDASEQERLAVENAHTDAIAEVLALQVRSNFTAVAAAAGWLLALGLAVAWWTCGGVA